MGSVSRPFSGNDQILVAGPFSRIECQSGGCLILNADDWGQDAQTTNAIFDCSQWGGISSVSAMVFMEDSERAASLALEYGIDAGLHLNLTTPFKAKQVSSRLMEAQGKIAEYLRANRFAQTIFHPGLVREFDYVVKAQLDEFQTLYGGGVERIDGHHHMHLCQNILLKHLLPVGIFIRRHFSFKPGEKAIWNRAYRGFTNWLLSRRYRTVDYFFGLPHLEATDRLVQIVDHSQRSMVEVAVHPAKTEEYRCLTDWDGWPRTVSFRELK